jgi:hypothetical protein
MTATSISARPSEKARGPRVRSLRLLVGLNIALALLGVAIAGFLVVRGAPAVMAPEVGMMGRPVETSFGAFTVTSVTTTFVPDTQGPPTAAQHAGTNGTNQLQVSVRLVNENAEQGLAYAPAQLRLVTDGRSGKGQDPDGSSLQATLLPRGGSIDGRVWFDVPKGSKSSGVGWWLEFKATGGDDVRVALDPPKVAPSTGAPREVPNLKHAPADKH